jgi:hypothetical protein
MSKAMRKLFFDGAKSTLGKLDYLIIKIHGSAIKRGLPSRIIREGNFHAYYINDYKLEHSLFGECKYVAPFYKWLFCIESPTGLRAKLPERSSRLLMQTRPRADHETTRCNDLPASLNTNRGIRRNLRPVQLSL